MVNKTPNYDDSIKNFLNLNSSNATKILGRFGPLAVYYKEAAAKNSELENKICKLGKQLIEYGKLLNQESQTFRNLRLRIKRFFINNTIKEISKLTQKLRPISEQILHEDSVNKSKVRINVEESLAESASKKSTETINQNEIEDREDLNATVRDISNLLRKAEVTRTYIKEKRHRRPVTTVKLDIKSYQEILKLLNDATEVSKHPEKVQEMQSLLAKGRIEGEFFVLEGTYKGSRDMDNNLKDLLQSILSV